MADIYRKLEGDEVRFVRIQPGAWTDPIQCELVYLPLPNAEVDLVEAWFSGKPLPRILDMKLPDTRPSDRLPSAEEPGKDFIATTHTPEVPPFVALSYTWGNPGYTEELQLDGHSAQKTVNLIAGLRQLRALLGSPSRAPDILHDSGVLFWVDALCINQADEAEKSAQVPRMGAIYGSAGLVIAWLGDNGEDDDDVQEFMNVVNSVDSKDQSTEIYFRVIDALDSNKLSIVMNAYNSLSRRPWFERIWVIQEMATSQCSLLLSGRHWCYYEYLWNAWLALVKASTGPPKSLSDMERLIKPATYCVIAAAVRDTVWIIFKERYTARSNEHNVTLQEEEDVENFDRQVPNCNKKAARRSGASLFIDWINDAEGLCEKPANAKEFLSTRLVAFVLRAVLIGMYSGFEGKASIPHDYFYGILSIGGHTVYPRKLAPDYTLRFEDVFHEYTRLILAHTGDLDIIPRLKHELKGVPSWVPDYRYARIEPFESIKNSLMLVNPTVSVSDDGMVCFTKGVHLGEAMSVLEPNRNDEVEKRYTTVINRFNDLVERVCREEQLDKNDVLAEALNTLSHYSRTLKLAWEANDLRKVYDDCVSQSLSMGEEWNLSHREILIELCKIIARDSWFITSRGLIMTPISRHKPCMKGDILAMLKGAEQPWLLRPVVSSDQDTYTFIGACSVIYRNVQNTRLWDSVNRLMLIEQDAREKAQEHFFAGNRIREFRLV